MQKPIAIAITLSAGIHLVTGFVCSGFADRNSPVLASAAVQHFAVNFVPQPPRSIPVEKPAEKVISTVAKSAFEQPKLIEELVQVEDKVPPAPVKPAPLSRDVDQDKPEPKKTFSEIKTPEQEPEAIQDSEPDLLASDVENTHKDKNAQGGSSEYRLVKRPNLSGRPAPLKYPYRARRMGQEGIVVLEVKLDDRGDIVSLQVEKTSGHQLLDKAAVAAVSRWRFLPLIENGQPLRSRVRIPVRFKLS